MQVTPVIQSLHSTVGKLSARQAIPPRFRRICRPRLFAAALAPHCSVHYRVESRRQAEVKLDRDGERARCFEFGFGVFSRSRPGPFIPNLTELLFGHQPEEIIIQESLVVFPFRICHGARRSSRLYLFLDILSHWSLVTGRTQQTIIFGIITYLCQLPYADSTCRDFS